MTARMTQSYVDAAFYDELVRAFSAWPDAEITDAGTREECRMLLHREARLLDQGRFDDWLSLYSPRCVYWVPATPGGDPRRDCFDFGAPPSGDYAAARNAFLQKIIDAPRGKSGAGRNPENRAETNLHGAPGLSGAVFAKCMDKPRQSRVFRTATRSIRSSWRRTMSPDTAVTTMTISAA